MKKFVSFALVAAVAVMTLPAFADFGHSQHMSIDAKDMRVSETSARLLVNEAGDAPELLVDITDGHGAKKIAGYKLMVMSRTYSLAAEMRPPRDGAATAVWGDVMRIHRGTKLTIGVPVKSDGEMDIANARLLDVAVVSDADTAAHFKDGDSVRPAGEQLVKEASVLRDAKLRIEKLEFPDLKSGEHSGGGVQLMAEVMIDGKLVKTQVDSTFTHFYTVKPRAARAFAADGRLF